MNGHEKQAIIAIGAKVFKFLNENQRLNDQVAALQETIKTNQATINDCVAGLRVFGIDVNAEGVWRQFNEQYFQEITSLLEEAGPQQHTQDQAMGNSTAQTFISARQPISILIIERLKDVGFHGSKALPLRNYLKETYNIDTHYKTVGMTLYRLSQENPPKVHRIGHKWFFGPPIAETKNPDASTSGQTKLLNNEGGTDA